MLKKKIKKKKAGEAACRWLTPEIPATWEAEIERFADRGQPRQRILEMPPQLQNNHRKMDWRWSSSSRAPTLQMQNLEFKISFKGRKSR
jgi:hypothetical protein